MLTFVVIIYSIIDNMVFVNADLYYNESPGVF